MAWKYSEPTKRNFDVLEPGDYMATVIECGRPELSKSGSGNYVVEVKVAIQPSGVHVFYHPWSGQFKKDGKLEFRDNISEFLLAVNREPRGDEEPNWGVVIGARGKCKVIQEEYNGARRNKVAWFYSPRSTKTAPAKDAGKGQSISADEFQKLREQQEKAGGGSGQVDPDNIPYACDRG
jgi:hypothetical protein